MRKGINILKGLLGQSLHAGFIQEYRFNHELLDNSNLIFLKFNSWIQLSITDGTAILDLSGKLPELITPWVDDNGNVHEYPHVSIENKYPEFCKLIGHKLVRFHQVVFSNSTIACGVRLIFEPQSSITLYSTENDEKFILFTDILPPGLDLV